MTLTTIDRDILAARLMKFLGDHDESLRMLTESVEKNPDDASLRRYRGHARITARDFEGAVEDLEHASRLIEGTPDVHEFYQKETIPDLLKIIRGEEGDVTDLHMPVNDETIAQTAGLYKSTLHTSVWYHLGVARYLLGDFEGSLAAFRATNEVAVDDDSSVAILDWCYMGLRRLGRHEEAARLIEGAVTNDFSVTTSEDFYHRRLKMYKGEQTPEQLLEQDSGSYLALATQGYGVGNWYLYNGNKDKAREIFELVVENGTPLAFAYMAAEVDLARMTA